MRPRVEPTPAIKIGGRQRRSDTRYALAGAYIVTLSTAIGDLGVQLHTTYVGHPDAETAIAELLIAPGPATTTWTRSAAMGELPVSHARELCLYDHLLSLRDRLDALGYDAVTIDVPEAALASISH